MLLESIFVRFYKSFNYDYLRKHHGAASPQPWDDLDGTFYPYVKVSIDAAVTTIVGANESGKSHLLSAIERAIGGENIRPSDFCRYSHFFEVVEGQVWTPDFGTRWKNLSSQEKQLVRDACGVTQNHDFDLFLLFRTHRGVFIYLPNDSDFIQHPIGPTQAKELTAKLMPHSFRIDAQVALPSSVPIPELAPEVFGRTTSAMSGLSREKRFGVNEVVANVVKSWSWFKTDETIKQSATSIRTALAPLEPLASGNADPDGREAVERRANSIQLAYKLIRKVAKIDAFALKELYQALREGREGHVDGLIQRINDALARNLNFPRFWAQDRDFALMVAPREQDLVFTIRDRTGTQYSFDERSSGLKYFLSYYVQYLAHEPSGPDTQVLLMDEPDAYLSCQAQQDLLKVFQAFANPDGPRRRVQVVYVTHSPFLIDRNHADRIRVLEKGVGDEGTRVVRDVSRNHYEPLRSSFGAFVGETTFIGNCNLMVEGGSDQILLATAAAFVRRLIAGGRAIPEMETLDLNALTIVPAGGAGHIPYLVYLARGRDVEKPAVVVLLDSDKSGDDARKALKREGARNKPVIADRFVFQIGELTGAGDLRTATGRAPIEIEDLFPISLCVGALQRYALEFWGWSQSDIKTVTEESVRAELTGNRSIFDAVDALARKSDGIEVSFSKIGFARAIAEAVAQLARRAGQAEQMPDDVAASSTLEANSRILFAKLRELQRFAERERRQERVGHKVDRIRQTFFQDNLESATKERARLLLSDLREALDSSDESDFILSQIPTIERKFGLGDDPLRPVEPYSEFKAAIAGLRYAGRLSTVEPEN